jgi:hypothetical protein
MLKVKKTKEKKKGALAKKKKKTFQIRIVKKYHFISETVLSGNVCVICPHRKCDPCLDYPHLN